MRSPPAARLALLALVLAGACSDDSGGDGAPAATGSRDEFCAELRTSIEQHLTVFDPTNPATPDETAAALERLATAAPAELDEAVDLLARTFAQVTQALEGVDPSNPEARDALEALDLDQDAIGAAQDEVLAYATDECSINLQAINDASVPTTTISAETFPPATTLPLATTTTVPA